RTVRTARRGRRATTATPFGWNRAIDRPRRGLHYGAHADFVEAFNKRRKKRRSELWDPSYDEDVTDYDEKLRRRRQRWADRRTGYGDAAPDTPDAYRLKPDD